MAVALGNWLSSVEEPPEEALAILRSAVEDDEPLVRERDMGAAAYRTAVELPPLAYRGAGLQRIAPRKLFRPSRTRKGTIRSAAAGSAHHHPARVWSTSPSRRAKLR